MHLALNLAILAFLFLLACFFASSETAIFSLTPIEKKRIQKNYPRLSAWVSDHLSKPGRTLITILIGNLIVHILATAMITLIAVEIWGPRSLGIALVIFTVSLIFIAEIIPKVLAVRRPESCVLASAVPLRILSVLFYPLRKITQFVSDKMVLLLTRDKAESGEKMSEDELKTLIKIGEEQGVLDQQERYMINKLFELGERPVREIMTPRVDVVALDIEDLAGEHIEKLEAHHFSHFPVYKESPDQILGVLSVQDYMLDREKGIEAYLKEPVFVPETKRIDELLEDFRKDGVNFAVCVDEYGGTAGIVTLEDILEEIFGEFYDEYARVENPIRPRGHGEYIVEAKMSLSDFNNYFSVELEAKEASTIGGFILEQLGEVPQKGQLVETPECDFRVGDVIGRRRIHNILVRPKK